ncbi:hypothetical protein K493DRAFT_392121 [Basidiobolus meristosporus CBS 931.73]|uniref:Uncharacterized protein n=1 Tax=Basidiobolus meristosporus CBS 931.73 TaxID=1314790 RepID=A0A1Y1WW44_9FUNG|nr:hypothetical protein K493DRAFT_392121 [Basidiobolus meristosporus CBS 931.73]|eukprot:ORX77750.1 hypothetical protein K493DRAFT_392121 [Basidiobolus meristosporus CBS 931.73]
MSSSYLPPTPTIESVTTSYFGSSYGEGGHYYPTTISGSPYSIYTVTQPTPFQTPYWNTLYPPPHESTGYRDSSSFWIKITVPLIIFIILGVCLLQLSKHLRNRRANALVADAIPNPRNNGDDSASMIQEPPPAYSSEVGPFEVKIELPPPIGQASTAST